MTSVVCAYINDRIQLGLPLLIYFANYVIMLWRYFTEWDARCCTQYNNINTQHYNSIVSKDSLTQKFSINFAPDISQIFFQGPQYTLFVYTFVHS